jgi:sterol desaturase/sphingolipid hydroxylase (fatty acid hydroxylase superfamily)
MLRALVDYSTWPALWVGTSIGTWAALRVLPASWASSVVLVGLAVVLAIAERLRPDSIEHKPLDQPLYVEIGHFLFNDQAGYFVALGICALVRQVMQAHPITWLPWPTHWPLVAQVLLGMVLSDTLAYWQHRLFHRAGPWRFHRLHHEGRRLNLMRSARFQNIDLALFATATLVPLALLGAPEIVTAWVITLSGALGLFQHTNLRMRTPGWMDRIVCTPAVHRWHHSRDTVEGNRNFGTVIMLWDWLFGTYLAPRGPHPAEVGVKGDENRGGFWRQFTAPFRRAA